MSTELRSIRNPKVPVVYPVQEPGFVAYGRIEKTLEE